MSKTLLLCIATLLALGSLLRSEETPTQAPPAAEKGITRPSESTEYQFNQPGLIEQVMVKEGDSVKKGDLLVKQNDTVEQQTLKSKSIDADSDLSQRLAQAKLDVLRVDLKRKKELLAQQNVSQAEYEEADLKVKEAELDLEYSGQKIRQAKIDVEEQRARIELKKMISTFDGIVQKVDARAGQNADPSKPQVIVVRNDPLWIDVHAPSAKTKLLKEKQPLQIRYDGEDQWQDAEIIFLDPVVDAQSDTQLVRLQMKNPSGRRAGLRVDVRLPEEVTAASARQ